MSRLSWKRWKKRPATTRTSERERDLHAHQRVAQRAARAARRARRAAPACGSRRATNCTPAPRRPAAPQQQAERRREREARPRRPRVWKRIGNAPEIGTARSARVPQTASATPGDRADQPRAAASRSAADGADARRGPRRAPDGRRTRAGARWRAPAAGWRCCRRRRAARSSISACSSGERAAEHALRSARRVPERQRPRRATRLVGLADRPRPDRASPRRARPARWRAARPGAGGRAACSRAAPRSSSSREPCDDAGAIVAGSHTSKSRPSVVPWNAAGATPMIVSGASLTRIVRPDRRGAPPKRVCQ